MYEKLKVFSLFQFNEDHDKISFNDLNGDCLFLIIEYLEFSDSLRVAQINGKFSALAADVYRCKYSRLEVIIDDMYIYRLPDELKKVLNETGVKMSTDAFDRIDRELSYPLKNMATVRIDESITPLDYEAVLIIFKNFGNHIKNLHIKGHPNEPFKQSLIAYLINKYSTESLVAIKLEYNAKLLLEFITKPLINVESVAFSNFINRELDSAQRVKNLFPRIKRLEISNFEQVTGSLQLENVTELVIHNGHVTSPVNLHFPKLQTLSMNYRSNCFDKSLAFLTEHNHLRQLHLNGLYMNDLQFTQLTENLNDLEEMTLERGWEFYNEEYRLGPNAIVAFLRSHIKVKQLSVIDIVSADELQDQLRNEWNIRTIDNGLSFERK